MRKHKHAIWIVGMLLAFAMLMQQGTMGKVHAEEWKNTPDVSLNNTGERKVVVEIHKRPMNETNGDANLAGATLQLTGKDSNGNSYTFQADALESGGTIVTNGPGEFLKWVTGTEEDTVTLTLPEGLWEDIGYITFTLSEEYPPINYETTDPITFSFKIEDGDKLYWEGLEYIGSSPNPTFEVTMVDQEATGQHPIKISKTDITGDEELAGARLQILDGGNVVEEWVSGKTPHEVTGLTAGKTYILRETVAPDGYAISSDTRFVLKADGTIDQAQTTTTYKDGVLLVKNALTSVKISKVDITNGGVELEGATLQILDEDGNVVEINGVKQEWVSGKTPHEVTGLTTGKKYTLRETVAPDGYTISTDTTFVLKADGTIDSSKTTTTVKNGVLLVEDTKSGGSDDGNKKSDGNTREEKTAEKTTTAADVESVQSPKTGDSTNLWMYVILMVLFAGTNFFLHVKRDREHA